MIKKIWRRFTPNPLDRLLKKAAAQQKKNLLIGWNRGLGDIALGLYALVTRIRTALPDAQITFITRPDLKDGFALLPGVKTIIDPTWRRGETAIFPPHSDFDLVIENPDPTQWLKWQLGHLVPKMEWNGAWDVLCEKFNLPKNCIGIHVQTETSYGYEKNWPLEKWEQLFDKLSQPIVLFGFQANPPFKPRDHLIDLRGKTSLLELLSIIKNRCSALVVPDSGVLSLTYYLNISFPLKVISLWADPRQGILKQAVASPTPLLGHHPLLGKEEKISSISIEEVLQKL
jgi:ADP-heptose:LPS heptosyltransferase